MAASADRVFRSYVASYEAAIRRLRYADLKTMQPPPYAPLLQGGGGTAYVLWRLGQHARAKVWLTDALADRRDAAFDWQGYKLPRDGYLVGRAGLYWVRALLEQPRRARAVAAFTRYVHATAANELMGGAAGYLTGARLLLKHVEDPRLRRRATDLAATLRRRLRTRSARPWQPADATQFAHGWPGVLHALMSWSLACGEVLPTWFVSSLERLADVWSPRAVSHPELLGSWCNGAAGAALLWSAAFRSTRNDLFRERAIQAGHAALAADYLSSDLCCGMSGAAFALLEIESIDPRHGWREQARALTARAIQGSTFSWPNGLFRGHPGLVCLALDLVANHRVGFPTISG